MVGEIIKAFHCQFHTFVKYIIAATSNEINELVNFFRESFQLLEEILPSQSNETVNINLLIIFFYFQWPALQTAAILLR